MSSTETTASPIRAFRSGLRALEREITRALEAQTDCCGVTAGQCHLLLEVEERAEGSIGDFARALDLDLSTLSRAVDGLVKAGLLSRAADEGNRRRQIIRLSPAGAEKARAIHGLCDPYYGALVADMPEERRTAVLEAVPYLAAALRRAREGSSCCRGPSPSGGDDAAGTGEGASS